MKNQATARRCPRCNGRWWYDQVEDEIVCLQCGYRPRVKPLLGIPEKGNIFEALTNRNDPR